MNSDNVFDLHYNEYDNWFIRNQSVYLTELLALKKIITKPQRGLEIGIGTGRYAQMLGIPYGIDISFPMLKIARERECIVACADANKLPFKKDEFEYSLLMVTLCFVKSPKKVIKEAKRILVKDGKLVIGIIDKNSKLGRLYQKKDSVFYKSARFFSTREVMQLFKKNGFRKIITYQTLFNEPDKINEIGKIKKGYGKGGFVVIAGIK